MSDPDHLDCAILSLQNIAAKQAQMATRLLPAQFIPTAGMSVMVMLVWNEGARVRELESRMVRLNCVGYPMEYHFIEL